MKAPSLALALACLSWLAPPSSAQQLVNLPVGSWANDVTPDGEVVVGTSFVGAFIWRWRVDPEPTFITGGDLVAVSDDGSVALGNTNDPVTGKQVAALWTSAGGWQPLPVASTCDSSATTAYGLSGDGKSATGLAWADGCDARAFLWTEAGGLQLLESLGNGVNRASAISRDGQVMGGFAQGSFNRTPAVWSADGSGWIYDIDELGEVHGLNNDGSTRVGEWNGDAFFDDGSGVTILGSLMGSNWTGIATDISEDGHTICGFDTVGNSRVAWLWNPADGIQALDQVIADAGFPGAPGTLVCRAMSDDGSVIVGGNVASGGGPFGFGAFIFERETSAVWSDVGQALAGSQGDPRLTGFGTLEAHTLVTLVVEGGAPGAASYLLFGLTQANMPFKGGVLVPSPDLAIGPVALDGSGDLVLADRWPGGLPAGTVVSFQHWIVDAAGPAGYAASNALTGLTP